MNEVGGIFCPKCGKPSVLCTYWDSGGARYFYDNFRHNCLNPNCGYLVEELGQYGGESPYENDWPGCPFCSRRAPDGKPSKGTAEEVYLDGTLGQRTVLLVPDFDQVGLELMSYLAQHPEALQKLEWRKFEQLLEAIFRNQGFATELGPGSGDEGVDLRLLQKDSIGQIVTLVQAKRYKSDSPIRLEAVQALYAVVEDRKANRGLFVTTSRYLPGAKRFAERQNHRVELASSEDIVRWCKAVIDRRS